MKTYRLKKLKLAAALLLYVVNAGLVFAQTDEQLAEEYSKSGDCVKANIYYEKILAKGFNKVLLKSYVNCQIKLKNQKGSEDFFKAQIKRDKNDEAFYNLFWGHLLESLGKVDAAENKYEQAIASLENKFALYPQLADQFRDINPKWAVKTLLKAREVSRNGNLFRMELADLYKQNSEPQKAIEELLAYGAAMQNPDLIRNMLQDFLSNEKDREILEKYLYEGIQKRPGDTFFIELLVWNQIQRKEFYKAFLQERALDKRFKYEGNRIFPLANLALQNQDFENASAMYDYLVKEYPMSPFYPTARRLAIYSREEKVKSTFPIVKADVQLLIEDYNKLLKELGADVRTLDAMRNMAILYAFYLDDKPKAIGILKTAIEVGKKDRNFVDKCKLDLGDIYLLQNEPWEATLLYSQVEKSQKDDVLAYDAKLKNAKLHYFKGDFELAKSVLDILKKATSREIANDANALGLLIMDNIGLDTAEVAMRSFANVELLLFQNKTEEGLDSLQQMIRQYPDHSLSDEILWLMARTYLKLDNIDKAVDNLKIIVDKFHYDILADDALFALAKINQEKLNNREEAMRLYQQLIEKYPGSIFTADARKRFRELRGDVVN